MRGHCEREPPSLPLELLLRVAENLDSAADISRFGRVSRFLHTFLQPRLYSLDVQEQNCSALYWAAAHDRPDTVKLCLQAGAEVDYDKAAPTRPYDDETLISETGCVITHPVGYAGGPGTTPLHVATSYGNVNVMRALIENGAHVEREDPATQTSLHIACCLGKDAAVTLLLNKGADIHAFGSCYRQPLHIAACGGYLSTVQLLLDRGANPSRPGLHGFTPLHDAVAHGSAGIAKLLIQGGSDTEALALGNTTPLRHAVDYKNGDMVSLLLAAGAQVNGPPNTRPLHGSIRRDIKIVKNLLDHGADANAVNEFSETPLLLAIVHGNLDAIHMLFRSGADMSKSSLGTGRKAGLLFSAVQCGRLDVMKTLAVHGIDLYERNDEGRSAYDFARDRGMVEMAKMLRPFRGPRPKPKSPSIFARFF